MIKASSDEGMLVMDPFAGCGTTIDASHTLNRFWIGIDLTILSLDPMRRRLADRHGLEPSKDYEIHGYPTNMQEVHALVREERKYHDFSNWAVTRLGLQPTKSVGDGGKDGEAQVGHITLWDPEEAETTNTRILAEVKSGKPTISQVRAFCRVMDKHNAIGVFITIEPVSAGMRQEAADMGTFLHNNKTFPRLQFWQIDDAYFENPSSLRSLIRLPKQWLEPMRKMERHFTDTQMSLLNLSGNVD
jgi:site-specific DNA-methyltransferase (adenine-specific)